jgi:hypothetical protein
MYLSKSAPSGSPASEHPLQLYPANARKLHIHCADLERMLVPPDERSPHLGAVRRIPLDDVGIEPFGRNAKRHSGFAHRRGRFHYYAAGRRQPWFAQRDSDEFSI